MPARHRAGQAWECEPERRSRRVPPGQDRRPVRGRHASPARRPRAPTRRPGALLGERLGEAFQVADDIRDVAGDPEELGKPVGRDVALGRRAPPASSASTAPSRRLDGLVAAAVASHPAPARAGRSCGPDPRAGEPLPAQGPRPHGRLKARSCAAGRPVARPRRGERPLAGPSWRDRWLVVRDRLLASPRFQRWAAAFPLTRPIARRRARALFDLCAGLRLRPGPARLRPPAPVRDPGRGAADRGRPRRAPRPVPRRRRPPAAVRPSRCAWSSGVPAAASASAPWGRRCSAIPAVAAMVEHHALLYADLRDPVALLRGEAGPTGLARYWPYARRRPRRRAASPSRSAAYSALMAASQPLVAGEVLDAYPLRAPSLPARPRRRRGRFLAAAAARAPHLRLDALRSAAGRRAGPRPLRRGRARGSRHGVRRQLPDRSRCPRVPTSSRWSAWSTTTTTTRRWRILRAARRALPAGRHACCWPSRWPGRPGRADRRRLLRLLPAGDGQRPAAHAGRARAAMLRRRRLRPRTGWCRPAAAADPPYRRPGVTNMSDKREFFLTVQTVKLS